MPDRDLSPEEKSALLELATGRLATLVAVVDEVLEAARQSPDAELDITDEARSFLLVAYGRAYRCLVAIRNLAAWPTCDADHAFVLLRSLITLVARSLWIAEPDDAVERESRFNRWGLSSAIERKKMLEDSARLGFGVGPGAIEQVLAAIERSEAEGIAPMPPDEQLLYQLGLAPFYPRAFRVASDVSHFSLGSAMHGFTEAITLNSPQERSVGLRQLRPDHAEEALALAFIVYGEFLQRSEAVIGHGLAPRAAALMAEWMRRTHATDDAGDDGEDAGPSS